MGKSRKPAETVTETKTFLEDLSKEELKTRYVENIAERARLAEENKNLVSLYKSATSTAKMSAAEAKLKSLQDRLAALQATPIAPVVETIESVPSEAIAG